MIKILVADDEALARDELIYLLERHDDVTVVGEAANGREVLDKIERFQPDVIFLDIQMPEMDGLTAAKQVLGLSKPPYLVFATAFDCHALEAFSLEAVDYLLKPFSPERVDSTLERLRKLIDRRGLPPDVLAHALEKLHKNGVSGIKKIPVDDGEQILFIDPGEIIYIFREDREVWVCLKEEKYHCKYSLHELEDKLARYGFFRSHRGYLVNLRHVKAITPWFNGAYQLIMQDDAKSIIPVSRNQVKALYDALSL